MDMQIEQLNDNIAKSLRILIDCADDDLVRAARDELSEEKKDLLDALDVLGVYYRQRRGSWGNLIPTPEFAFYGPYMKILDKPEISEKYDYYREEKRIYEKEQKTSREQKTSMNIQDIMNRRWREFIQPVEAEEGMRLAASRQSGDDRLRNSGQGGRLFCTCTFTRKGQVVQGLTMKIRRVRNMVRFLLTGNAEQKNHITSLNIDGQSILMENGCGKMDMAEISSKLSPLYAIDDEGNIFEMNIVLDDDDMKD